jgi:hypothetical protein
MWRGLENGAAIISLSHRASSRPYQPSVGVKIIFETDIGRGDSGRWVEVRVPRTGSTIAEVP